MAPVRRIGRFLFGGIVAIATIGAIVGAAFLVLLSPLWVFGEQDRVGVPSLTGYTVAEVRVATGAILADLVVGPPDFDVEIRGEVVLSEAEREHLRDVRTLFLAFFAIIGLSIVTLLLARWRSHGSILFWRAVRSGAAVLAVVVAAMAGFAVVAFTLLFEVFHRVLFAPGTYTFDPTTDRMVQLFPEAFWFHTTIVLAIGLILSGLVVRTYAGMRLSGLRAAMSDPVANEPASPGPPSAPATVET
jgi:integral membrane protein (TIGR01906 family)